MSLEIAFDQLKEKLQIAGLDTRWYKIPRGIGYQALLETYQSGEIYCLETHLGPSQVQDYETYGIVQVLLSDYPSLAVMMLIERHKDTNMIAEHQPIFNIANDKSLSTIFLPALFTAFNKLEPSGSAQGILVQLYNTKMSFIDLIPSSVYTVQLIRRFKQDGQLALVAADFDDPLLKLVVGILTPIIKPFGDSIKIIPRTTTQSNNEIPLDNGQGGYFLYKECSTALDEALKFAIETLNKL